MRKLGVKRSDIHGSQRLRISEEILPSGRRYFVLLSRSALDPVFIFLQDIDLVETQLLPLNCKDFKNWGAKLAWTTPYATLSSDH